MKTLKAFRLQFIFILFLVFVSHKSSALTKYWIGSGTDVWNNTNKWSTSSGGTGGAGAPGTGDVATFDANSGNCNISTGATPGTLTITSGYGGTITQSNTLTIGAGGASLSGGTFTGGSSAISCSGSFTISGTAFTSTSGTFTCVGNFTFSSGSFTHNSGTVNFPNSNTITGSVTFYNLTFATNAGNTPTFSIAGGTVLTVANTLAISTTNAITINTGEIDAQGNITVTNTASGGGGSALIKINGTGSQTLTGSGVAGTGKLPKIEIDKSSGTLTLASVISIANDWTYTQGTISFGTGTPVVDACASLNMDCQGSGGTMSFYDFTVYGGTTTLTGDMGVAHDLTINGSNTLDASSKTINLSGRWTNTGTFTSSTSTVAFVGTALQTINKTSTEAFYNLTMNKTSGRLLLNVPITVANNVTFTEGIIKASSTNNFKVLNDGTASGGNDSSFVYGYYKKVGDEAFTFALGDTSVSTGGYHPLSISAPSSSTDAYTAQYFNTGQSQGSARDSILNYLSTCEHWKLDRDVGSSAVTVKLAWNTTSCNIDSLVDLRVAYWNGSKWKDKGGSYTGNTSIGDVVTSSTQSSFGYFIIAKKWPDANAGADVTICSGGSTNLVGSQGGATAYNWSPSTALSCSNCYNPTASPTSTITYTYTVTYSNGWQSSDNITVTVNTPATASAGSNQTICSTSTVSLTGSRGGSATSSTWTTSGSGTFTNASLTSTTYTPSAGDISGGSVTLTITTDDPTGPCTAASSSMTVTINPAATASAGTNQTICSGSTVSLSGSRGGSATSSTWTTSGSGSFANASLTSTTYTPSAGDITTGTVTLTITTDDPSGPCPAATSNMTLTINLSPAASAGPDTTIYIGESITIGGSPTASSGASPYTYSWSPSTALSSSTVANPVASPRTNTTYVVTVTGNNSCTKRDTMVVRVDTLLPYSALSPSVTAAYYTIKDSTLCFIYEEEYMTNGDSLQYNIYDNTFSVIVSDQLYGPALLIDTGHNRFRIKLNEISGYSFTAGYYMLEVINRKNEKMYLRFKV